MKTDAPAAPILAIDDSLTIRKLLELALGPCGHPLQTASSASDGLELARRIAPCLILLDYILPDRKGLDVCHELAADPRTARIPIVIMSAKSDDIRHLFRDQPSVVEFVAKPFSPTAIAHVVKQLLQRFSSADPPSTPASSLAAQPTTEEPSPDSGNESTAQRIYAVIADHLARIPEWLQHLNGQPAAPFIARRLLTNETVTRLREAIQQPSSTSIHHPALEARSTKISAPTSHQFSGDTGLIALPELLRVLRDLGASGELRLGSERSEPSASVWFERGELRMALPTTHTAINTWLSTAGINPLASDVSSSTPWQPCLQLNPADRQAIMPRFRQQSLDLLTKLSHHRPLPFVWHDQNQPPTVVTIFGRPLPLAQLTLERLRQIDDWVQIETEVSSLDQICARAPAFRTVLNELELNRIEQAVLHHINGRRPVRELVARCHLSTFEVFHALFRLIKLGLIINHQGHSPELARVVWCAANAESPAPLTAWLHQHGASAPLVIQDAAKLGEVLSSRSIDALIIDVDAGAGCDAEALTRLIRSDLNWSHTPVVALIDRPDRARSTTFMTIGCDAVLAKPVHIAELTTWLLPASLPVVVSTPAA